MLIAYNFYFRTFNHSKMAEVQTSVMDAKLAVNVGPSRVKSSYHGNHAILV
jgi:hypothetical protein